MIPTQNNSNHIAESEISKIFIGLKLFTFEGSQQTILERFAKIQPKLHENNKYRDPKLLIGDKINNFLYIKSILLFIKNLGYDHG